MPKLLLEDSWPFTPDRTKIVESTTTVNGQQIKTSEIPGILSQCDVKNGNGRRYRRQVWEKNLQTDSRLMDLVKRNQAWGILEHPKDGVVNVSSPISHMVKDIKLRPDGILEGKLVVFDELPEGFKLKSLIARGWDPLVSSRGYGSVVRATDGIDEVQDDYVCEGWDVVATPSFTICTMTPARESMPAAASTKVAESVQSAPSTQQKPNRMNDITTLKSNVLALSGVNILTAPTNVMVESFATVHQLHQQLSEHQVANPTAAYQVGQLHRQLEEIVGNWHGQVKQQTESLNKASADNAKLIKISEHLAKTTRLYREQLTTTVKNKNSMAKVFESVTSRARKWVKLAETRGQQNVSLEKQAQIAVTAINMLAEKFVKQEQELSEHKEALRSLAVKYHADTTKLGKTIVGLKHPEAVKEAAIAGKLESAKTAEAVAAILEEIEKPAPVAEGEHCGCGKSDAKKHGECCDHCKKPVHKKDEDKAQKESKTGAPAASAPAPTQESAPSASAAPAVKAPAMTVQEAVKTVRGDTITGHTLTLDQMIGVISRGRSTVATK